MVNSVQNPIEANMTAHVQAYYPLSVNNSLNLYDSLFTPLINVTIANSADQNLTNAVFQSHINFPTSMNISQDVCLALLVQNNLTCVNRAITVKNNWVKATLNQTGTYALIFNPLIL